MCGTVNADNKKDDSKKDSCPVVPQKVAPLRIDTHSHFVSPAYRNESTKAGFAKPDGMPAIPVSMKPSTQNKINTHEGFYSNGLKKAT